MSPFEWTLLYVGMALGSLLTLALWGIATHLDKRKD